MLSFYDKAFLATYYALDKMYEKYPSVSLVILVGDMCPFTFADLKSADPAAYHDFVTVSYTHLTLPTNSRV